MTSILGIDPAWTATEPSGVALISNASSKWRLVAVASSYAQYVRLADNPRLDWEIKPTPSLPIAAELLATSQRLLGGANVDLVAIDMPVTTEPIIGRRAADIAVSQAWGGRGAGTHSPNATRPGKISDLLREEFEALGYPLRTTETECGTTPALLEVYPHTALITLMKLDYRLQYKVSRARKYWRELSPSERRVNILAIWREVIAALELTISDIDIELPEIAISDNVLKRFEDAIDAVVCAWTGIQYLNGDCDALGDESAAIWVSK